MIIDHSNACPLKLNTSVEGLLKLKWDSASMARVIEFVDLGDDFRFAEERTRVQRTIRGIGIDHGFSHAEVQYVTPRQHFHSLVPHSSPVY
jgi:hypothetical protein